MRLGADVARSGPRPRPALAASQECGWRAARPLRPAPSPGTAAAGGGSAAGGHRARPVRAPRRFAGLGAARGASPRPSGPAGTAADAIPLLGRPWGRALRGGAAGSGPGTGAAGAERDGSRRDGRWLRCPRAAPLGRTRSRYRFPGGGSGLGQGRSVWASVVAPFLCVAVSASRWGFSHQT